MGEKKKRVVIALTGASGSIYGVRLINYLSLTGHEILCVISRTGEQVFEMETGLDRTNLEIRGVTIIEENHLAASIASGSFLHDGMVIVPCSMRSLTAVAQGQASNLIQRAADVTLKERRKLILVPRETPLNRLHLENMLRAHDAGAIIMPAMPSFYGKPRGLDQLVDSLVSRILDLLGINNDLATRWPDVGEGQPR